MKWKFIVVQKNVHHIYKGELIDDFRTFIVMEFYDSEIIIPHPITEFIHQKYEKKGLEPNTIKSYAEDLKKFLEYCKKNKNENGLKDLCIDDGVDYMKYVNERVRLKEIKPNNIRRIELVLVDFFYWLKEINILDQEELQEQSKWVYGETGYIEVRKNFFHNIRYGIPFNKRESNSRVKDRILHDFGNKRYKNCIEFLNFARIIAPEIALGIAFQFFGGLRKGEVVNLLKSSVSRASESSTDIFYVNVANNYNQIFKNKTNYTHEQVKVERKQFILNVPIVNELYVEHMKKLQNIKTDSPALFVSYRSGKPICGQSYLKKFNLIKEMFLNYVMINNKSLYEYLTSREWSSHFGRGVYTNLLIYDLNWGASEVRLARGDKSLEATMSYIEEANIVTRAKNIMEELGANMVINHDSLTNMDYIRIVELLGGKLNGK
ncbi:hypothetical protein U1P98_09845 [Lysinibacillus irui]|uniref:Core-binding (CB) domain-containing protein n=1 Tax=Lysinibacillus irui TaxID=2998077 RepID=A0ABU5NKN3_9BACI|nr:hypothetical protein [Lysinibacillus irui]MEA0554878.1 hypothetical protein [Lysinibacillus irui]MEA0976593.1 hypothetical protein [Lysinibacillus irui]MEA1042747.1 hypothetical protein [Lysinibacillus irui]